MDLKHKETYYRVEKVPFFTRKTALLLFLLLL